VKWFNAKSVEELKKFGKLSELKVSLKEKLGKRIKFTAKSWDDLLKVVIDLNDFVNQISTNYSNKDKEDIPYFKTESDKLIFYLLELDGEARQEKLKITQFHYRNKEYANRWRKDLARKLHPDVCKHKKSEEALKELNKIYKGMGHDEKQRQTADSSS
jgi:hypothetical protein